MVEHKSNDVIHQMMIETMERARSKDLLRQDSAAWKVYFKQNGISYFILDYISKIHCFRLNNGGLLIDFPRTFSVFRELNNNLMDKFRYFRYLEKEHDADGLAEIIWPKSSVSVVCICADGENSCVFALTEAQMHLLSEAAKYFSY